MKPRAIYELNEYLLSIPEVSTLLNYDGTGLRPFFPVQQTPESNSVTTFVVYTTRRTPLASEWWRTEEEVIYRVYGETFDDVSDIVEEISDIVKRLDESAIDLQNYLDATGKRNFEYHWVRLVGASDPEPMNEERGQYGAFVNVRMAYAPLIGRVNDPISRPVNL